MKYDYSGSIGSDPSRPWKFRPVVEVEIFGNGTSIKTLGLIDSGADTILINTQFAEALGINLENCEVQNTIGISGTPQPTYHTTITLQVSHLEPIVVPVFFIDSPSVTCLLGQEGFFDAYRIKFERDHKVFELVPVKK
jgi:hypothetical protein